MHPRYQFLDGERFDEVVVSADMQPVHPGPEITASRSHDYRDFADCTDRSAQFEAAAVRQTQVQQDDIDRFVKQLVGLVDPGRSQY
jgi:hypothetical protein